MQALSTYETKTIQSIYCVYQKEGPTLMQEENLLDSMHRHKPRCGKQATDRHIDIQLE